MELSITLREALDLNAVVYFVFGKILDMILHGENNVFQKWFKDFHFFLFRKALIHLLPAVPLLHLLICHLKNVVLFFAFDADGLAGWIQANLSRHPRLMRHDNQFIFCDGYIQFNGGDTGIQCCNKGG